MMYMIYMYTYMHVYIICKLGQAEATARGKLPGRARAFEVQAPPAVWADVLKSFKFERRKSLEQLSKDFQKVKKGQEMFS